MTVEWREAMEIVIARTRHERYRWLCSEENPDAESRDGYRALMIRQAAPQEYPSLATMASNALKAAGRVVAAAASGQPVRVPEAVLGQRRAICDGCEHWDRERGRCRVCGCVELKLKLSTERCPIGKWEAWHGDP